MLDHPSIVLVLVRQSIPMQRDIFIAYARFIVLRLNNQ